MRGRRTPKPVMSTLKVRFGAMVGGRTARWVKSSRDLRRPFVRARYWHVVKCLGRADIVCLPKKLAGAPTGPLPTSEPYHTGRSIAHDDGQALHHSLRVTFNCTL